MGHINNAFINTIDANTIARKYMHELENKIIKDVQEMFEGKWEYRDRAEIDEIYDNCTQELEDESEEGLIRDWDEITDKETITENQIKMIYYKLRQNKENLSFCDADLIIKILCDYDEED